MDEETQALQLWILGFPCSLPMSSVSICQPAGNMAAAAVATPSARVVLETDRREPAPTPPLGLTLTDERRYGDTRVLVYSAE